MRTSALAVRSLLAPIRSAFERRDFSLRDPALWRLFGNNVSTAAGVSVSEDTALNIAAFWRGVQVISGDMAAMPLIHYKRDQHGSKTEFTTSKVYKLLHDQPNPEMTSFSWREQLQAHLLTWGNAYSEIEKNNAGQPIGLWPLTPDRVVVFRDSLDRRIKYRVSSSGGPDRIVDRDDMLHIPGLGFDGLVGYSVIGRARQSLGLMSAAERFGATFFGNDAYPGGILSTEDDLDEDQKNEVRNEINRLHQGPGRAHGLMILSGGQFKYDRMSLPPNDAQFLETRKFQVTEIARWLGVPPHKIYDLERSTNNNIEQQGLEYYSDTIWHWCERWERELERKLIPSLERSQQFIEFKIQGILRADIQTRYSAYNTGKQGGWLCDDEIRELENMNPLPNGAGQIYLRPLNSMPSTLFEDYWKEKLKPKPAPVPPQLAGAGTPTDGKPVDTKPLEQQTQDAKDKAARAEAAAAEARAAAQAALERLQTIEAERTVDLEAAKTAQRELSAAHALAEQLTAQALEATRDAEQLRGQLEAATQAAAAAETRATAANTDRDRLAAQLAETQADAEARELAASAHLGRVQASLRQHVQDVERVRQEALVAKQAADRERRQHQIAVADRDEARATAAAATSERDRLRTELAAATAAACDTAALAARLATAETAVLTAEARCADVETVARAHAAALQAAVDARAVADAARDDALARQAALEADLVAARQATDEAQQALTAARAAVETAEQARAAAVATATAERDARTAAEQRLAAAEADRARMADESRINAEAASRAQTLAQREHARVGLILADHRDQIVDIMSRMIERETERLQRAQGSPEKLRHWVETFYAGHEEVCFRALFKTIRTHVHWSGRADDPETLTRILIREHIEESKRQIAAVADGDAEALAASVYALCQRWTRDRVDTIANRLLQQEIDAHVHARLQ